MNLETIFVTQGVPNTTFVQPPNFNDIYLDFRHYTKPVILEGQSGTGKTSIVTKILERLNKNKDYLYLTSRKEGDILNILKLSREPDGGKYIIDDFHRLPDTVRKRLADFAKIAADDGTESKFPKLIFVGINQIGEDLLQMSPDIAKRCGIHKVMPGGAENILELIKKGEAALNIKISNPMAIFREARGDYWLTQLFCQACCLQNGVLEYQEERKTIRADIKELRIAVIQKLKAAYNHIVKDFCRGQRFRSSNDPYFKLLESLSALHELPADINELANSSADQVKVAINKIKDHRLKVHLDSKSSLRNNFFYNENTKSFNIEDPALRYYIKHLDWKTLHKECGFKKIAKAFQFDIAISFAGENRALASYIAKTLTQLDVEVFYDEYYEANYLGTAWSEQFRNIFSSQSKLVVCLLDKNHQKKIWPTFERECFQERVKDHEVIPIFLDETQFVGIPKDIVGIKFKYDERDIQWQDNVTNKIITKLLIRLDQ